MSMVPTYVAGWRESVAAVLDLVDGLDAAEAASCRLTSPRPAWPSADTTRWPSSSPRSGTRSTCAPGSTSGCPSRIRRALGRPGGFDGTGVQVVATTFSFAMPYVLGKRVRPPAGTVVRWNVTGQVPLDITIDGDEALAHAVLDAMSVTP